MERNPNLKLIGIRRRQGFYQYEVAEKAGLTAARLSMIENRRIKPRQDEVKRIAEALKVREHELFDLVLDVRAGR